jgi:hypothetical protein
MSSSVESELVSFHRFLTVKLSENQLDLSPEDVLDLWREDHPLPEEFDDATEAVMEALADLEAGDLGIPFEEFEREFRARHQIPSREISTDVSVDESNH